MPWSVEWAVTIDGRDASNAMRPYLTDIDVADRDGTASDTCRLTFDDSGGQALLPEEGAAVRVTLNGVLVFEGIVDSTPWNLTRGGGRLLEILAKGRDPRGKSKEGQRWHLDDATLGEALEKGAKAAGLSRIVVDPELAQTRRAYWSPDGASFTGWATKLGRDLGATFKVRGDVAVFAARGKGLSATGAAMPTVRATIPGNVISIRLDPLKGRPRYRRARVRSFDRKKAEFVAADIEFDTSEGETATEERRFDAADEEDAKTVGKGRKTEAEREGGNGSIEMDLEPAAQAEGTLILTGARDGINGTYRIVSVAHRASRSGGATTSLEIKQPGGEAGRDGRAPQKAKRSKPAETSEVAAPFT